MSGKRNMVLTRMVKTVSSHNRINRHIRNTELLFIARNVIRRHHAGMPLPNINHAVVNSLGWSALSISEDKLR